MTYKKIAFITGPTAVGKTALSIKLAEAFGGEIISCDSMQLYRGMNIGTAKPTPDETKSIKHHMIDIIDIHDSFSVVDYVKGAELCINNIYSRNKLPIFCGGTGLYIDSVVNSTEFGEVVSLPEYRDELQQLFEEKGAEHLHDMLREVDPEAADKIDYRNIKRVIRALEVYKASGVTITEHQRRSRLIPPKFDSLVIELEFEDRELLYDRIDKRVDLMMEEGLLDEVKTLCDRGLFDTKTASQAIGYKEFRPYFDGMLTLEECIENIKRESRRYAKRQMTWFRRSDRLKRITVDGKSADEVFAEAKEYFAEFFKPEIIWGLK